MSIEKDELNYNFIITIDDKFCKWEFIFSPDNLHNISINDVVEAIEKHFDTKMVSSKLID